ncbi:MAG: hypothetical protein OHK0013_39790 [Sandaracinaceae bacterium]
MTESGPEQRKGGRPRREDGPKMPYHEVDRLLVEGELVEGDDGVERRVWLSQREVAKRFEVSPSLIAAFAKQHRCTERRKAFEAKKAAEPTPAEHAEATAEAVSAPASETPAKEPRRKPGRPRKAEAPLISYEELDRLLVFGEVQVLEDGTHTTVYPTYRALAERFGVAPSVIASYAKSRNCLKRREQTATRVAVRTEEKLIDLRAEALAVGEDRLVQMIDEFLLNFEKALKEGRVRADNPTDVNTLVRLKQFVLGGADSRQEVRNILSLEALQERYARTMRELRDATPAMGGVIDARAAPVVETERAESNTEVSVRLAAPRSLSRSSAPPPPPSRDSVREPNVSRELLAEVSELVHLARELAVRMDAAEADDDALLEVRVLRAVERVERRLPPRDGADVGPPGAQAPEDAP